WCVGGLAGGAGGVLVAFVGVVAGDGAPDGEVQWWGGGVSLAGDGEGGAVVDGVGAGVVGGEGDGVFAGGGVGVAGFGWFADAVLGQWGAVAGGGSEGGAVAVVPGVGGGGR